MQRGKEPVLLSLYKWAEYCSQPEPAEGSLCLVTHCERVAVGRVVCVTADEDHGLYGPLCMGVFQVPLCSPLYDIGALILLGS